MKINGNLSFHTLGSGELQNAIIERLDSAPGTTVAARLYYNTTTNKYCYYNGTAWVCFATGENTGDLQAEIDAIELAVGLNTNGTFNANAYTGATYITTPTSVSNAIMQLDAAINANNTLAELDDVALASLTDNDILQYDAGSPAKWKNVAIGSASGIQPYDAGLTALATGGTGLVAQDGDNIYWRTLTAPSEGITVSNGTGVVGNPTLALANDLGAVEGLTSTGFGVRTAADTWATRSIEGTAGNIVVTGGSGATANPVVNLATLSIPTTAGSFLKFDYDTYGRVTSVLAVAESDITALVDDVYVNVNGDTMTGTLVMSNDAHITLPTPSGGFTSANDVINKNYVDNLVSGISWKEPVDSVGTSLPGTATTGQRFLNTTDNKIYTATAPNTWDAGVSPAANWAVFDKATDGAYTYDADTTSWVQFTGAGQVAAGVGLSKTGNTLDVNLGAGIYEMPTDEVGVDAYSPATMALSFSVSGVRDDTPPTNGQLSIFTSATGGVEGGIGNAATELALDFVGMPTKSAAVEGEDFVAFYNVDATDHETVTFSELFQDLDVPYGITATGLIARTGADAYASRTIGVDGAGAKDGLTIQNGDGVGGNPTIGLDIVGLDESGDGLTGDEEFPMYNPDETGGAANLKVTLSNMVTYIHGATTLDSLDDCVVPNAGLSLAEGQVLAYDADGGQWTNHKIYHLYTSSSASTTHTVTHELGCQYCNVTVVDSSDEVIIPQSITFTSVDALSVTFNTAIDCKVVVMGVDGVDSSTG